MYQYLTQIFLKIKVLRKVISYDQLRSYNYYYHLIIFINDVKMNYHKIRLLLG